MVCFDAITGKIRIMKLLVKNAIFSWTASRNGKNGMIDDNKTPGCQPGVLYMSEAIFWKKSVLK